MPRQKAISIESVYGSFESMELEDKIALKKLIDGHLEDQMKLQQNTISASQLVIEKLREVVPVKE